MFKSFVLTIIRFCVFTLTAFLPATTDSDAQITVSGSNADGSYSTLTGPSGAFAALNGITQSGKTIFITITANPTEPATGNVALTGAAGMWASLTISPANGARTVSASVGNAPLINLNGTQNVTIDGLNAGGNSLTISNSSTAGIGTSTIQFTSGAANNTLQNCTILGSPGFPTTATIYFNSTSSTGNNNHNTITHCNIGPASNTLANRHAIYCNGSSLAPNASNVITYNNIYSFSSYGIELGIGTGDSWNISNNSFYRTSSYTYTGTYPQTAILINSSVARGFTISGNYIGGTSADGGTANTPWNLGTGSGNGFIGIYIEGMATTGPATNILGNKIQNFISASTQQAYTFNGININQGIVNIGDGTDVNQNVIGNASSAYGVKVGSGNANIVAGIFVDATSSDAIAINNNVIANIAYTGTSNVNDQLYGIYYVHTCKPVVRNCKIYALSSACSYTGNSNPILAGIYTNASGAVCGTISGNEIYNLTTSSPAVVEPIYGISLTGISANPPIGVVSGNFIHSLVHGGALTSAIAGINVAGGGSSFFNNLIQLGIDTSGNSITRGYGIYGIRYPGGTSYGNLFYHNTVYIGGTGVSSTANTFCFYRGNQPLNIQVVDTVKNNIFYNNRQNGLGSAFNLAIADNGVVTRFISNYNDLYAATPNVAAIVANSTSAVTFATWQGTVGDANGISSDPLFVNPDGTNPDFHLMSGTPCNAVGTLVPGIIIDYYGSIRANYTPVDLGAVVYLFGTLGTPPSAKFLSSDTVFCVFTCISFKDTSTNNPTGWVWSFEGGNPSSSNDQNPQNICYTAPGTYKVSLVASNTAGNDTLAISNFITVIPSPKVPIIHQIHDTTLYFNTDTSYISYQWYDGNTLILGATDTALTISHLGEYYVEVKNKNGCSTAVGISIVPTGASTHYFKEESGIRVYPNPVKNQLTVSGLLITEGAVLEIYNVLGESVYSQQFKTGITAYKTNIDISSFSPGVYFMHVMNKQNNEILKFVKILNDK